MYKVQVYNTSIHPAPSSPALSLHATSQSICAVNINDTVGMQTRKQGQRTIGIADE